MGKYFVLDFKKVRTEDEFTKIVVGHNLRNRHTKNNNINRQKTSSNIVLQNFNYSIKDYLNKCNNLARQSKGRARKKDSAFAFNIVIDCSVMEGWNEDNYIEYLMEAEKFLKKHFEGQELLSSVIHLDEGKPHLHISFSYFNTHKKRWNQKGLAQQKLTNLNNLLKRFEMEVGKKFGLQRGDGQKLKQLEKQRVELYKHINQQKIIKKVQIKQGILKTKEQWVVDKEDLAKTLNSFYKNFANKNEMIEKLANKNLVKQNHRLQEQLKELEQLKKENETLKIKAQKLDEIADDFEKIKDTIKELDAENAELKEVKQEFKTYKNKVNENIIEPLRDFLDEISFKAVKTKIIELSNYYKKQKQKEVEFDEPTFGR